MLIYRADTKQKIFSKDTPIVVVLDRGDLEALKAAPGGAAIGILAGSGVSTDDRKQAVREAFAAWGAETARTIKAVPSSMLPMAAYTPGTPEHLRIAAEAVGGAMLRYARKQQLATGCLDTSTYLTILAEIADMVDMSGFALDKYCASDSGEILWLQLRVAG